MELKLSINPIFFDIMSRNTNVLNFQENAPEILAKVVHSILVIVYSDLKQAQNVLNLVFWNLEDGVQVGVLLRKINLSGELNVSRALIIQIIMVRKYM